MAFFLGWIILSVVLGVAGSERTCGFAGGFFGSLLLSPLIGFIIVILSTRKSTIEFQNKMLGNYQHKPLYDAPARPTARRAPYTAADYISDKEDLDRKLTKGIIDEDEYNQMYNNLKRKAAGL